MKSVRKLTEKIVKFLIETQDESKKGRHNIMRNRRFLKLIFFLMEQKKGMKRQDAIDFFSNVATLNKGKQDNE